MTTVAFLGLGHMGLPMAANLVRAGYSVAGFDVMPAALDSAREVGIATAATAVDAVADTSIVITMFPSGKHVLDALTGADGTAGLLATVVPGTLFIECSTIAVDEARAAHDVVEAAGCRMIGAPVSGGVVGAEAGTLAFMVGGADADVADAMPLLEVMGRRIVHCGGAGLGQAAKVCNNMILGVTQIAVAEAFVLGERLGLSHEALFDVAANASGQCWALTTNCPVPGPVPASPANRDYAPGFAGALMSKDLGLAEAAVTASGVSARMGMLAREIYRDFAEGAGGGRDFSAIIETVREESAQPGGTR